jgi:hypothetical protein
MSPSGNMMREKDNNGKLLPIGKAIPDGILHHLSS